MTQSKLASVASGAVDSDSEGRDSARLVLQRGVFTGVSDRFNDDLYARIRKGKAHRERSVLHLEQGATVSTDAYFGRFAASYFQCWTVLDEVEVSCAYEAEGLGVIQLWASDSGGHARTLAFTRVEGAGKAQLKADLSTFVDGGALWIEFTASDGRLVIRDLEWSTPAPATVRPVSIAICTFNRPVDCAATIAAVAGDDVLLAGISAIYVIDQGTDHVADQPLFAEVVEKLGEKLVYLQQPNLGGAGGFTRGMFESTARDPHANVILMDDDIVCEPESILRMNSFANVTSAPTLVGAQMLSMMSPNRLHIDAEVADLAKLKAGRRAPGAENNVNLLKKRQNKRIDAGYNAWWSCLIPSEVIEQIGLPIPLFFQWDDIEFGLRARASGFTTVTLPNAGVWHADFHWKDRDDWARYFSVRNGLIVAALHSEFDEKPLSKRLTRDVTQCLVSMQYGLAHTMLSAIEDFLSGPGVLRDGGQDALRAIREQRKAYPETMTHPMSEIPGVRTADLVVRHAGFEPQKSRLDLVLAKRVANQWAGRTIHGVASIPVAEAYWWHVSLFDTAVVTDASQAGVRVRRRDKVVARALSERAAKVIRRFRTEGPAVQRAYRDALPQLTSRENWARLYGK